MLKVVLIDPGHGGEDPGSYVPNQVKEKNVNLVVSFLLSSFLRQRGAHVFMTRETDCFLSLHDRSRKIESINPDAFLSIHCNGDANSKAHGFEVFYRDKGDLPLAKSIAHYMKRTDLHFRGVFNDVDRLAKHLAMLNNLPVPSALVELGFLTNSDDREYILANEAQLAEVIGHGVLEFLGEGAHG